MQLPTWTLSQYAAAGKHAASYAAGLVTMAAVWGLVGPGDTTTLTQAIDDIVGGVTQFVKGVAAIVGVVTPLVMAWKAKNNASPTAQIKSVVANLTDPLPVPEVVQNQTARDALINAVGEMPEVRKILADSDVAMRTPSPKVVTATPHS